MQVLDHINIFSIAVIHQEVVLSLLWLIRASILFIAEVLQRKVHRSSFSIAVIYQDQVVFSLQSLIKAKCLFPLECSQGEVSHTSRFCSEPICCHCQVWH